MTSMGAGGRPLRAGLIGLGAMGRQHARVMSRLQGVDLVGVVDPCGDPHGAAVGVPVAGSVAELVDLGIDYAVVASPTTTHAHIGLELADAGINALIEKPIAHSSQAASKLVHAFEQRGLVGAVAHIERYNTAVRNLRKRLQDQELGSLYQVVTRRQGPFPSRISDVGVAMDLAIHDLDLTAWMTGEEYVSISARCSHKSGRPHEDLVAVVGQLSEGTIANHLVNWLSPMKERVTVVTGDRGCFVADTLTADLTYYANGSGHNKWEALNTFRGVSEGNVIRYAAIKEEPLAVEHQAFRDALLGHGTDIVGLREGLKTVVLVEALLESAKTGTTVDPGILRFPSPASEDVRLRV
ncbi:Gfo/Idh/MocA family protein [Streptomyces caeni]|uniref:Gfo/Idh/MocA family protein n=1 Tax=Streptomyces caeni TaxID=2307231 RepID=A0ABW4IND8_9ACTN